MREGRKQESEDSLLGLMNRVQEGAPAEQSYQRHPEINRVLSRQNEAHSKAIYEINSYASADMI